MANFNWKTDFPPGYSKEEIEAKIVADMTADKVTLDPEKLFYHTVFLGEDIDGPTITVLGSEHGAFDVHYDEEAQWVSIAAL